MELTKTPDVEVPPFHFVPAEFDPSDLGTLEATVQSLLDRPLASAAELRQWIVDWGEVARCVWAGWARRLTAMNRDTKSEELKQAFLGYAGEVMPAWTRHQDKLNRRYLDSPHRAELGGEFAVFDRKKRKEAEIFREENTRLAAAEEKLSARFQEIQGAVTIEFRGEMLTREQCRAKLQATDRATREEAYLAGWRRALEDRDAIDETLDELVRIRHQMAVNAGFESYNDYRFAQLGRFDYTPTDCVRYAEAVEKVVVPELRGLRETRRQRLGLDPLRPYDAEASLFGVEPAKLFEDQAGFIALVDKIFGAIDPVFAEDFDILVRNGLLDLMSRPGKAPGGYNCPVEDILLPFIFYNAVGRRSDLRVLLHEGGHAFHTLAVRDVDVEPYRSAPTEFCEVASMAMELFGFERLKEVLAPEEVREFTYGQFEGIVMILCAVALVDSFQAWMYRNPTHSRAERRAKWVELSGRFVGGFDWTGLEEFRENTWQQIPHLFSHPLYFIEYGIAQIGALQLWRKELADHDRAVAGYRGALALGGSRPLPELFEAAGIRFAMDEAILSDVVPDVMAKLRGLVA